MKNCDFWALGAQITVFHWVFWYFGLSAQSEAAPGPQVRFKLGWKGPVSDCRQGWLGLAEPGRVGLAEQPDKIMSFIMFSFLKLWKRTKADLWDVRDYMFIYNGPIFSLRACLNIRKHANVDLRGGGYHIQSHHFRNCWIAPRWISGLPVTIYIYGRAGVPGPLFFIECRN